MNADDERDLEPWLYRSCCEQSGVEPLRDDEARERARKFHDLLAPAFEREFRLHDRQGSGATTDERSAHRPDQRQAHEISGGG